MAKVQVIYGKSRRALAKQMRARLAEANQDGTYKRAFLIVPEQMKASTERLYFEEDESRGLLLSEVLSFRRLATRLQELAGKSLGKTLSPELQMFVLGQVTRTLEHELSAYGDALKKVSFLPFLAESIGDFLRYEVDANDLISAANSAQEQNELRYAEKFTDLAKILEAYTSKLHSLDRSPGDLQLSELADLLERICSELRKHGDDWSALSLPWSQFKFLASTKIFIHGFGISRSFTPQELRIIKCLALLCESLTISAEADILPQQAEGVDYGDPKFRSGRALLYYLDTKLGANFESLQIQQPRVEYQLQYFARRNHEIQWAAGEIKRLLFEKRALAKDIAIALADPTYTLEMQNALRALGIPYFANREVQEMQSIFLRFMENILQMLRFGLVEEFFIPYLRSPLLGVDEETIDAFENFLLARGITQHFLWDDKRFSDAWQVPDTLAEHEMLDDETSGIETEVVLIDFEEEDELPEEQSPALSGEQFLQIRDSYLKPILELKKQYLESARLIDLIEPIRHFLLQFNVEDKLDLAIDVFMEVGEANLAEQEAKAWNMVLETLSQFEDLEAEASLKGEDFLFFLYEAIINGVTHSIPAEGNQVMLAGIGQIAQEEAQIIFVLGAEQKNLPGKGFTSSLLHKKDREVINQYVGSSLPDNEVLRVYATESHIYGISSLAAKVYFSYTGTEDQSAYIMDYLAKQEQIPIYDHTEIDSLDDLVLARPKQAFSYALSQGDTWTKTDAFQALEELVKVDDPVFHRHHMEEGQYRQMQKDGRLSLDSDQIKQFFPEDALWSISRLEKYATCPFAFYSRYILALKERDVWTAEASHYGNLLHKYFELAQKDLEILLTEHEDMEQAYRVIEEALADDYIAETFARARQEDNSVSVFWEEGESFALYYKATRAAYIASLEQIREYQTSEVKWKPYSEEWSFGAEGESVFEIENKDANILVQGRIDRVDTAEVQGETWARLLDYKSGQKRVSYPNLYYGLDLQLPIYLSAFESINADMKAKDAAYVPLTIPQYKEKQAVEPDTSTIEKESFKQMAFSDLGLEDEVLHALMDKSQQHVKRYVNRIYEGDFSASPTVIEQGKTPCTYCEFKSLCRINQNTIEVNRLNSITKEAKQYVEKVSRHKDAITILLKEEE